MNHFRQQILCKTIPNVRNLTKFVPKMTPNNSQFYTFGHDSDDDDYLYEMSIRHMRGMPPKNDSYFDELYKDELRIKKENKDIKECVEENK